jgi:Mrp family chromosome partitioning ATPase
VGEFLEQLRRHYRWVIVDSPPLASVTDALLLARHADHTVLVIQHDKVDKKVVKRSLMALRRATDHVLGAVLNAVNVKTGDHYYYYHQDEQGAAGKPNASAGRGSSAAKEAAKDATLVS